MGVLPKKERKKKHDTLDSLALNITVPSLALKATSGLDYLTPPSPSALTCLLPLDPYVYCKGEKVRKEVSGLGKKPPSHPAPHCKQQQQDHTVAVLSLSSCSRGPALSSQGAEGPTQRSTDPPPTFTPALTPTQLSRASGTPCTAPDHQNLIKAANLTPEICKEPTINNRVLHTPGLQPSTEGHPIIMSSSPGQNQAPFLVQLQRLMVQRTGKHEDLRPHFGVYLVIGAFDGHFAKAF